MKKLLLTAVLAMPLILVSCGGVNHFNKFYENYMYSSNATNSSHQNLDPGIFKESPQIKNVIDKFSDIRTLKLQKLSEQKAEKVKSDLNSALQKDNFKSWYTINKPRHSVTIRTKGSGKKLKDVVMAVERGKRIDIVYAKTKLTKDEFNKIMNPL